MHARDFCVAVKRLARLQSTIRQYNVRDTPGAVFAGRTGGEKRMGRERGLRGDCERRRRGGFRADTEISPILEGAASPHPGSRARARGFHRTDSRESMILTLVYRGDAPTAYVLLPSGFSQNVHALVFSSCASEIRSGSSWLVRTMIERSGF